MSDSTPGLERPMSTWQAYFSFGALAKSLELPMKRAYGGGAKMGLLAKALLKKKYDEQFFATFHASRYSKPTKSNRTMNFCCNFDYMNQL